MTKFPFLQLKSFDTTTEDGRQNERYRRAALTTLLSVFSRGAALAVLFVSLRVALPYLGQARYGVWMTISSLTTALMVFDFGIGNGMVSRVASLAAVADRVGLKRQIALGLTVLAAIGIVVGGILACAAAYAPIGWLYKDATPELLREARTALVIFSALFGISIPLQAAHRIYAGLQEGYFSLSIAGLMSLLSLLIVPVLPALHADISDFVLVAYGLQLASGAVLVVALQKRFSLSLPAFAEFRLTDVRALMSPGGLFFLLQIAGVIGWDMDPTLVSVLMGPAAVALLRRATDVPAGFRTIADVERAFVGRLRGRPCAWRGPVPAQYAAPLNARYVLPRSPWRDDHFGGAFATCASADEECTRAVVAIGADFRLWTVVSAAGGALACT